MSGKLITPPFRMSFPHLFKPNAYQGAEPKYSVTALWDRTDISKGGRYADSWAKLIKALDLKSREFFDKPLAKLPANIRRGIRNGEEKSHLNGYGADVLFAALKATEDRKPQIVDLRKQLIPDGDTSKIYPGAWARASINIFAYDNIGKGLAFGLNNLQWLGQGERLDSITDAREDFDSDPDDRWFSQEESDSEEASTSIDPEASVPEEDEIPF